MSAKSSFMTPVMELRMMRWYSPTYAMAKVNAGRNRCFISDWKEAKPLSSTPGSSMRPVGNQRSLVANSMIMRRPNQKVGIE